jgi:RNA polymerase sigma-70 factor (ECF subfamily)
MDNNKNVISFSEGNNEIVSFWYLKWKAELFLVAYNYFRNKEDAEDVLSECFAKLLQINPTKRKEKFIDHEIDVKALLIVMIKNKCLDELKQRKNRSRIVANIIHLFNYSSVNKSIETIDKECFQSLCNCIPEKERLILLMNIDGFNHSEIADKTGLSEKTISNNLTLARKKVKQLWEDFMN